MEGTQPVTGKDLIKESKRLTAEGVSKPQQAKALGYVRVAGEGEEAKEVPDVTAYQNALLAAAGIDFPVATRNRSPKGFVTVTNTGLAVVGKSYLNKIGAVAGTRISIQIEEGALVLIPVPAEAGAVAAPAELVAA
jgi:hypothetical protein